MKENARFVLFGAEHVGQGAKATTVIGVYGSLFGILAEARGNLRSGMRGLCES